MFDRLKAFFNPPKPKAEFAPENQRLISGGWWGYRPYAQNQTGNLTKELSPTEHRTIVSASNRLFWNFGPVQGGIEAKATFAIGRAWEPVFMGEDAEWGKKAAEWLSCEWFARAYINGIDFKTGLYLDSLAIDRDGDTVTVYTQDDSGFPCLQSVPWYAIGFRDNTETVQSGRYKGLRQRQGVVLSRTGQPVAIGILGATEAEDRTLPIGSLDYLAEPRTHNQTRGLPAFTAAILDLRDLTTTQGYIRQAMMIASSIGLIEHNEQGYADPNDPALVLTNTAPSGTNGLLSEVLSGGLIRYFKANSGSKLEQLKNEVPSEATERLMERLMRNALLGAGMPPEFYWKPEGTGANVRMTVEQVNRTIQDRQDVLKVSAKRRIVYAISAAMQAGILPPYKGKDAGGFLKWGFAMPPKITVDAGYTGQDARESYKLGLKNLSELLGEGGKSLTQHLDERENEELAIRDRMKRSGLPESAFRIQLPTGNPVEQPQNT